jgi:hypothetical protein
MSEPHFFKAGEWIHVAKLSAINKAKGVAYPPFIKLAQDTIIQSKEGARHSKDGKLDSLYTLKIQASTGYDFPDLIYWWVKADGSLNLENMDSVELANHQNVQKELNNIRSKIETKRKEIKALTERKDRLRETFREVLAEVPDTTPPEFG